MIVLDERQRHEHVVPGGQDRSHAEAPFEPNGEIDERHERSEQHRNRGILAELSTDPRPDRLGPDHAICGRSELAVECFLHALRDAFRAAGLLRDIPPILRAHREFAVGTELLDLCAGDTSAVQRGSNSRGVDRLRELQLHERAARELDAVVHTAAKREAREAEEDEPRRKARRPAPPLDEVEFRVV